MDAFYAPGHSAVLEEERAKDRSELRALEDEAIRSAVQRQIDCGLDVVTDGEFRRWMFMNSFYDAVDGVRTGKSVTFRNDRGEDVRLNIHEIVGRLSAIDSPGAREAAFMADASDGYPFKVTFPAPSIFGHPLTTVVGPDEGGYGSLEEFVAHAIEIERGLVADAIAAGARYVQFDFPLYPYLVDPAWIERFEAAGHSIAGSSTRRSRRTLPCWRASLTTSPRRSTSVAGTSGRRGCARARSSRSRSGSSICRTTRSWSSGTTWGATAGSNRSGSCDEGSTMVMGLVSTKTPRLEAEDDLVRRMEEAAAIVGGMDRLAISPQCGFASVMVGNEVDETTQWRKLDLVGRVADRIWG